MCVLTPVSDKLDFFFSFHVMCKCSFISLRLRDVTITSIAINRGKIPDA